MPGQTRLSGSGAGCARALGSIATVTFSGTGTSYVGSGVAPQVWLPMFLLTVMPGMSLTCLPSITPVRRPWSSVRTTWAWLSGLPFSVISLYCWAAPSTEPVELLELLSFWPLQNGHGWRCSPGEVRNSDSDFVEASPSDCWLVSLGFGPPT